MSEQLYDRFRRLSPKVTGGLIRMRSDTFRDSAVPETVAATVRRTLAPDRDGRYATPSEFAAALETALTAEAIEDAAAAPDGFACSGPFRERRCWPSEVCGSRRF